MDIHTFFLHDVFFRSEECNLSYSGFLITQLAFVHPKKEALIQTSFCFIMFQRCLPWETSFHVHFISFEN